jgi:GH15 family glucan-1,4-alpha-glucosidase
MADKYTKEHCPQYLPIGDYGVIGNQHTVALVGKNGSIDHLCFPRFDSPTVFAKILDSEKGGYFSVAPTLNNAGVRQQYLPDTNVLITRFMAEEGMLELTDFMPVKESETDCLLLRKITAIRGRSEVRLELRPRFNYAQTEHTLEQLSPKQYRFTATDGQQLVFYSDTNLDVDQNDVVADITIEEGQTFYWALQVIPTDGKHENLTEVSLANFIDNAYHTTVEYWSNWLEKSSYNGRWQDIVNRSALVLKLLTSHHFGSTVAAATTSLPEEIGGERNWDYRFTWIRDSAFTMYAFIRLGFYKEAGAFIDWIKDRFSECDAKEEGLRLMYRVNGSSDLEEEELPHLNGYCNSRPVRIGNGASSQTQLDIYGELMDSVYLYDKFTEAITYDFWLHIVKQIEHVCEEWDQPDHGIWEVRTEKQHFVYSKMMCWVAVDRAIRLAERRSFTYPFAKWRKVRDDIYKEVYFNYYDEEQQSYVQYKGGTALDASVLLMPLVRFIHPSNPRWQNTMKAIEKNLVVDTLVYRYDAEKSSDGLSGKEGTFSMCSFWYVECLARMGETKKARLFFEKMLSYANHLGIYAEQIGLHGEQLGNYPQAFTHLGLISSAYFLNRQLSEEKE